MDHLSQNISPLRPLMKAAGYWRNYALWFLKGKPTPPPQAYKIATLKKYAQKYNTGCFIETGTLYGDTTAAVAPLFIRAYTIELDKRLYDSAKQRFASLPNVEPLQGDSGEVLRELLKKVDMPTLFWLDGHWSGGITAKGEIETPVKKELRAIFAHALKDKHVVLIDDARCFDGTNDYPTIEQLRAMLEEANIPFRMEVRDDIIRIHR